MNTCSCRHRIDEKRTDICPICGLPLLSVEEKSAVAIELPSAHDFESRDGLSCVTCGLTKRMSCHTPKPVERGWEKFESLVKDYARKHYLVTEESFDPVPRSIAMSKLKSFMRSLLASERARIKEGIAGLRKRLILDSEIEDIPFGAQEQERVIGFNAALDAALEVIDKGV